MDFEKEISKALSDPDLMQKVSGILSSMGNTSESENKEDTTPPHPEGVKNILGALGAAPQDDRTRLLMAIKPFLSERRAPYMDSAVTILKLASLGKLGKDLKLL